MISDIRSEIEGDIFQKRSTDWMIKMKNKGITQCFRCNFSKKANTILDVLVLIQDHSISQVQGVLTVTERLAKSKFHFSRFVVEH